MIICVPTPLNKNREPDISYIIETGKAIAPHLQKGTLVALGIHDLSRHDGRGFARGARSRLGAEGGHGFSPGLFAGTGRPGQSMSKVELIPKVIGGYTPACLERGKEVYGRAIKTLVPVSSCRAAEATKLLENIFRSVNIALVNELKLVYSAMGIDVWEVINAAKTKPFGFMAFYPGPGLGGHCIPIDPFYLTWKAREYRPKHPLHRTGGRNQHGHADARGEPHGRGAERPAQGGERQPRADRRPGLQAECGRRARIAELRPDEFAQGTRRGGGLLRSVCAGHPSDARTCALGGHAFGELGPANAGEF